MNIKRNITFQLESRKVNGEVVTKNVPIRMRVTYAGKRIEFSTGFRIDATKWDTNKQRVKNGCTNKLQQSSSEINAGLQDYFAKMQELFKGFEVKGVVPTSEELKDAFTVACHGDKQEEHARFTLQEIFPIFMKESGAQNGWSVSTYKKLATVKKHLEKFDAKLSFLDLNETKLTQYALFLEEEGLCNRSILKQVRCLKWFLNWCTKNGYCTNNSYQNFKPKLRCTDKTVIFLTKEELAKLESCSIPPEKQYLERVRDVFIFCCYSGLRYSDVYNLKRSDIRDGKIEIITIKTADRLAIELNRHSKSILDKYKDIPFEHGKALPVISNQKMNTYLKELGVLAEINDMVSESFYKGNKRIDRCVPKYALLTTHVARRTFVCNALALDVPAEVVMKWTGHSSYNAMKPYIAVADSVKADYMKRLDSL